MPMKKSAAMVVVISKIAPISATILSADDDEHLAAVRHSKTPGSAWEALNPSCSRVALSF